MAVPSPRSAAVMRGFYRRFIRLSDLWPTDKSKEEGTDLGDRIREEIALAFPGGDESKLRSVEHCELVYRSLEDIVNDKYNKQFPVPKKTAFLGLNYEEVRLVTSNEGRRRIGWKSKTPSLRERFRRIFWKQDEQIKQRASPFLVEQKQ